MRRLTAVLSRPQSVRRFSRPASIDYPGAPNTRYVDVLNITRSTEVAPCFRLMNEKGISLRSDFLPSVSKSDLVKVYKDMCTLSVMDTIFYDAQRQGRISFYMTSYGEEAATVGTAAALDHGDPVYCQYRESGVLMWRGFSLQEFADQCFGNIHDTGKGRQMPVHYGSKKHNIMTISSPLTTQLPQASGHAYALKMEGKSNVVACYFGEGAASEGDFHAGLNFAATLDCPVLFICRNNGFAISTPTTEQYRGDGIVSRASGYGMHSIRVDGNDVLAVIEATKSARKLALEKNAPVLLELMTYRGGHHSTSDDSKRYRDASEINEWHELDNPIDRTRMYLESQGLWDPKQEAHLKSAARHDVLAAFNAAEKKPKPSINHLFTDVYARSPALLVEQQSEMLQHVKSHPQLYPTGEHHNTL